jgi:hypothetical protein
MVSTSTSPKDLIKENFISNLRVRESHREIAAMTNSKDMAQATHEIEFLRHGIVLLYL